MGKKVSDAVLDVALNYIKTEATALILTDAEPTDRANALANALANIPITATDITVTNGDVSGRKAVFAEKLGGSVTASGVYNHLSVISATDLLVTTTAQSSKNLNNGDSVDVQTWDYEIADPA